MEEIPIRTDLRETDGNAQTTMRCICDKTCKNSRGLKIHQSRMKCLEVGNKEQRTNIIPGKTEEVRGQESPHRAQTLQASIPLTQCIIQKDQVANKRAWMDFDANICELLQSSVKGDADKRLKFMTKIIYTIASDRFGCVEPRQPMKNCSANRTVIRIKALRKELRSNKKQFKKAKADERQPLEELRIILREKLKTVQRAELHRRRRKERARKRANFFSNPFGFARTLLGDKRNGKLEASEEETNTFLRSTMSDPLKD